MSRVSLVDLGSNSARLVVYEYERGRGFRLVDEIREVIRLGSGIARTGELSSGGIERALVALRTFADFAEATGLPPVRIMATSAVRSATNSRDFLDAVRREGLEIEVLSGEQEAEQGVVAVANSSRFDDAWVMDLGGGSAQLSCMTARRYRGGTAYPLGAVRTMEAYLRHDPPTAAEVAALEDAVDESLLDTLAEMAAGGLPLVAMGGTVRNLARAAQRQGDYPWPQMHAYDLAAADLDALTERLLRHDAQGRGKIAGINPYRGDIILAGALVFRRILQKSGLPSLTISGYGMREGALFQDLLEPPYTLASVSRFHIANMLWQYPQAEAHNELVVYLAARLFDGLAPLHGYDAEERRLLAAAAQLHDIGKSVHYRDHDKHGFYLLTSAPLPGFSHREQALLALLVRYHRAGTPNPRSYRTLLREGDKRLLLQLSACLRLAEYLDRSRTRRVRDVVVRIDDSTVRLELEADSEPWVEIWETQKQAPLFEDAFGKSLELRYAGA